MKRKYKFGKENELYVGKCSLRFMLRGGYNDNDENRIWLSIEFFYLQLYLKLPWVFKSKDIHDEGPQYGFYWFENAIWYGWGRKLHCLNMPWQLKWIRTSLLLKDGTWAHEVKGQRQDFWQDKWNDLKFKETHTYLYCLGKKKKVLEGRHVLLETWNQEESPVQVVIAEITVGEREWRQIWLQWLPWFAFKRRYIDVDFSDEVGAQRGSWKGGTTGCSYDFLPGETPLQALRRMELKREFR